MRRGRFRTCHWHEPPEATKASLVNFKGLALDMFGPDVMGGSSSLATGLATGKASGLGSSKVIAHVSNRVPKEGRYFRKETNSQLCLQHPTTPKKQVIQHNTTYNVGPNIATFILEKKQHYSSSKRGWSTSMIAGSMSSFHCLHGFSLIMDHGTLTDANPPGHDMTSRTLLKCTY